MGNVNNEYDVPSQFSEDSTDSSSGSPVVLRNKRKLWRPVSLSSLFSKKNGISISGPIPSQESLDTWSNESSVASSSKKKAIKHTVVTIVLVEARGLPTLPDDGFAQGLFCKISFRYKDEIDLGGRIIYKTSLSCLAKIYASTQDTYWVDPSLHLQDLGSRTLKSKMATNNYQPEWKQRFQIPLSEDHLLKMALWCKGKQTNCMGSCIVDLSRLTKDHTHDIWQKLDGGYGSVHLTVTMCNVRSNVADYDSHPEFYGAKEKYALYNLTTEWNIIGQLHVKVVGAKGLSGKPNAYCILEVDNQRVQTHSARSSAEPSWEKSYVFDIYDISSTLDLKVYDSNQIQSESLGRLSIPLLRISNRTVQWYALKDRTKRHNAKGNYPRVLLDMSLFWNPVKAAVRLFQPKEVKYLRKSPKFNVGLIVSNMEFMKYIFQVLQDINEYFKRLFEWDNQELSFVALLGWIFFWYNMTLWGLPLLLLLPFLYHWAIKNQSEKSFRNVYKPGNGKANVEKDKGKVLTLEKIQGFPELTLNITATVEYVVSLLERIYNLASFKVPFLSYLAMLFLLLASLALYFISFNYLMIALGIYKFTRKYLNPKRQLNNDLLDFISRVPDSEILRDWNELSVPEPVQRRNSF